MHNGHIESRIKAVEQVQATVLIHLTTWLRSPSRENRLRLDASLVAMEDELDRLLCPAKLVRRESSLRTPDIPPPIRGRGRPKTVVG